MKIKRVIIRISVFMLMISIGIVSKLLIIYKFDHLCTSIFWNRTFSAFVLPIALSMVVFVFSLIYEHSRKIYLIVYSLATLTLWFSEKIKLREFVQSCPEGHCNDDVGLGFSLMMFLCGQMIFTFWFVTIYYARKPIQS